MSPEYLDELADLSDPGQLWRLAGLDQMKLPPVLRRQLDTGVALRRHAEDERRMRELLGTGNSLLLTPIAINSRRVDVIATPAAFVPAARARPGFRPTANPPLPADPPPIEQVENNRRGKR